MQGFNRLNRVRIALHGVAPTLEARRAVERNPWLAWRINRYDDAMGRKFGAWIPVETDIGDGCAFPHLFHGIFINGAAKIGKNVTILHQVTIGTHMTQGATELAAPVIGDNVFIGAGAILIGRCVIGAGARIGAGVTLVNVTIPPGAVIINKSAFNLTEGNQVYPDAETQPAARLVS